MYSTLGDYSVASGIWIWDALTITWWCLTLRSFYSARLFCHFFDGLLFRIFWFASLQVAFQRIDNLRMRCLSFTCSFSHLAKRQLNLR